MKSWYSKLFKSYKGEIFRYNHEQCTLEYLSFVDFDQEGEVTYTEEPAVIDSIGLSEDNWNFDPQGWVTTYQEQLEEEAQILLQEFKREVENYD